MEDLKQELELATNQTFEVYEKIHKKLTELEEKMTKWELLEKQIKENTEKARSKITIDVGGTRFTTTKQTLLSFPKSYFVAMLNWNPEEDGSYFIDRDPELFKIILNYLRTNELDPHDMNTNKINQLKQELDYYQIQIPELDYLKLTLNPESIKGKIYLSEDRLSAGKTSSGHCSVGCSKGFEEGTAKWQIVYQPVNGDNQAWLFIGIHPDPLSVNESSYGNGQSYGLNVSLEGNDNNGTWIGGTFTKRSNLVVLKDDIIKATLYCESKKLEISARRWVEVINLPQRIVKWYPIFCPHGASFTIFSELRK